MKTNQINNWRSGPALMMACGLAALTTPATAGKPPKGPPPEPPPVTFTIDTAGTPGDDDDVVWPVALNDHGTLVAGFYSLVYLYTDPKWGPVFDIGDEMAFVVEPVDGSYFIDADGDGVNDLFHFLPGPSEDTVATDINNLGQITGRRTVNGQSVGTIWDGDTIAFEMPNAELIAINDSGSVVGVLWREVTEDYVEPTTFIVVARDADLDGRPDTWFTDDDGDEVNDLFHIVHEVQFGAEPVGVFDDLSVLCREFWWVPNPEAPEQEQILLSNLTPSVVRPDFGDADGDGNPWYADIDGDHRNDLTENFPGRGTVASTSGGGLAAGSMRDENYAIDATLFDSVTLTCLDLNWVDPNAKPGGSKAEAFAVNEAGWAIGQVTDRHGKGTQVFWTGSELWNFRDIAPRSFRLTDINQSGVILGSSQDAGIHVAIPSVSP